MNSLLLSILSYGWIIPLFLLLEVLCLTLLLRWSILRMSEERLLRKRLKRRGGWHITTWLEKSRAYRHLVRHVADLLEALQTGIRVERFLLLCSLLLATGLAFGSVFFGNTKGVIVLGLVGGLMPYVLLRAVLLQKRMQAQLEFLPAVELFYQCYLATGEKQVRTALQRSVQEQRLLGPMQAVFEQLHRNLSVRGDDESSLRLLTLALGHEWATYFANILRVSLTEGTSISSGLKELITDMRKSRVAGEQERNKLLEIRIANFTPLLFLGLFVGINAHYSPENAYRYYLLDPAGRDMLLNAFILMFVSFVMGLWLSRRRM